MTSDERLREAVAVYRQAKADKRPVRAAIARHLGTSQQDAKALIKEARDRAFLDTYSQTGT